MSKGSGTQLQEFDNFWMSVGEAPEAPPLATVVIPAYQAAATVSHAIQSVLAQKVKNIEVIVADDGSTDATWEVITDFLARDSRVRALRNKKNSSKAVTMNRAIKFTRGRWIAVLDADDRFHPDRLAVLMSLGEKWRMDAVADNQLFYDAVAKSVAGSAWSVGQTEWELKFDDYLIGSHAYERFNLGMLKPIVRSDFVRNMALTYDEQAKNGEDFFYLLRLFLLGGKIAVSDTAYYFYTQPFGSVSRQWSHTARQRYDFQHAYCITQTYVRNEINRLTPRQLHYLKLRSKRMHSIEHYFRAREAFTRKDWRGLVRGILHHPDMLVYFSRRIADRCFDLAAAPSTSRVASRSRKRQQAPGWPLVRELS